MLDNYFDYLLVNVMKSFRYRVSLGFGMDRCINFGPGQN